VPVISDLTSILAMIAFLNFVRILAHNAR